MRDGQTLALPSMVLCFWGLLLWALNAIRLQTGGRKALDAGVAAWARFQLLGRGLSWATAGPATVTGTLRLLTGTHVGVGSKEGLSPRERPPGACLRTMLMGAWEQIHPFC